jgi:hypothetical protein
MAPGLADRDRSPGMPARACCPLRLPRNSGGVAQLADCQSRDMSVKQGSTAPARPFSLSSITCEFRGPVKCGPRTSLILSLPARLSRTMKKLSQPDFARLREKTRLALAGRDPADSYGFVNPAIVRGSTVVYPNTEDFLDPQGALQLRHARATRRSTRCSRR